jgi:hypothetical protein
VSRAFVIGYDPGGNDAHGLAVVDVQRSDSGWLTERLRVTTARSVADAIAWLSDACADGTIVAVGVDTLTEWSSSASGFRPADLWLRKTYPAVRNSVMSPNSILSSMTVSGAAFLTLLAPRFRADAAMVTEAHPKVCYYALTGARHTWSADKARMAKWLVDELAVETSGDLTDADDNLFDAGLAALAALRGANREWTLDLHALDAPGGDTRVRFCGPTRFWWPSGIGPTADAETRSDDKL